MANFARQDVGFYKKEPVKTFKFHNKVYRVPFPSCKKHGIMEKNKTRLTQVDGFNTIKVYFRCNRCKSTANREIVVINGTVKGKQTYTPKSKKAQYNAKSRTKNVSVSVKPKRKYRKRRTNGFNITPEIESGKWIQATEPFHVIDLMRPNDSIIPEPITRHKFKSFLLKSALYKGISDFTTNQKQYLYIVIAFSDVETEYIIDFCKRCEIPVKNIIPIDWDIEKLNLFKDAGIKCAIRANIRRDFNVIIQLLNNLVGKNWILYSNSYGQLRQDTPLHKGISKIKNKPIQHTFILAKRNGTAKISKLHKLRRIYGRDVLVDADLGTIQLATVRW